MPKDNVIDNDKETAVFAKERAYALAKEKEYELVKERELEDRKADSVWITKNELKKLLQPFLTPIIDEPSLADFFTETKFKDETLNAITFTYDPSRVIPDSIPLRHWDVYVHPETGNVEKVYIVKNIQEQGQLFTQQLTWQTNKMVKITSILNTKDGNQALLKEVVFIWNF